MKQFLLWIAVLCCGSTLAQTLDDGLMMPKKYFCTGFLYTHSHWDKYWEGSLKRDNQNIGTFSSSNIMYVGNYGITDRLNIIAMAPYISNQSNQGTLTGLQGVQDLTLGGKYRFVRKQIGESRLSVFWRGYYFYAIVQLFVRFAPNVYRAGQHHRFAACHLQLPIKTRVVRKFFSCLFVSRQRNTRPPLLLH